MMLVDCKQAFRLANKFITIELDSFEKSSIFFADNFFVR